MLFYSLIFILSVGGVITIVRRNREEFEAFNFADFMDRLVAEFREMWRTNLRDYFLLFLEKRLRGARVVFLKAETKLLRAAKHLRGIKEKNGNGNGNH